MKRIRQVLSQNYIGAIVIGWLIATGIGDMIEIVTTWPWHIWELASRTFGDSFFYMPLKSSAFGVFLIQPLRIGLKFLVAYLLARWLYRGQSATQ